jgi:hypothetical protein
MDLPVLVLIFLAIVALIFMPMLRRLMGGLTRIAIFVIGFAAAAAGVAMLMNNETIFEKPGAGQRVERFLTVNSAASSASGSSSVLCKIDNESQPQPSAAATPAATESKRHTRKQVGDEISQAENAGTATRLPHPVATPAPLDDVFPELIRRSYPGLPRQKLFDLSKATVDSLGGWRVVKADPHNFTIDCIYTTRILHFQDDVKITVQPSGDVDICSRSGTARPHSTSMLRYFPGDLGANIGHIKEFYEVLEPKMDQAYQDEQNKQDAKKPH